MRPLPSKEQYAVEREPCGMAMRKRRVSERTMGRKERVCGQIGVRRMAGMEGWMREPPAEREYAVDPGWRVSRGYFGRRRRSYIPVGVEKIQPSAWTTVSSSLSP